MGSIFIKNKYGYKVGVCNPSAANVKKSFFFFAGQK